MVLSSDIADLIGFPCEGILYGVYVVLACITTRQFIAKGIKRKQADTLLLVLTILLFCFCSTHYIIQWVHYVPHLKQEGIQDISAENILLAAGDFFLTLANVTGDMVLIYRCYLIWEQNYWIVVLPTLPALGSFVIAIIMLHNVVLLGLGQRIPSQNIVKLGTALLSLPLCTNVLVTSLIVGRLSYLIRWTSSEDSSDVRVRTVRLVRQISGIFIESGMLYLIGQLIFVILFAIRSPGYQVIGYMVVQIYGIAPTLILYRVGKGVSMEQTEFAETSRGLPVFYSRHTQRQGATITNTTDVCDDFELTSGQRGTSDSTLSPKQPGN